MASGRPRTKRTKATKQQVARRARGERQALESLARKRHPFAPLLREIVGAVLHAEAPRPATAGAVDDSPGAAERAETWVEVGSGLGQLRELLPSEVLERLVHTEVAEWLVRGLQEQHPQARALTADVTQLPFDDASVDAVLGLCVVDSFSEPAAASREIARVLRPGGRFFHFLDAATNIEPVLNELVGAGQLPLPNFLADIALGRPDLLDAARTAHLIRPYHDVLSVPLSQFMAILDMLRRAGHRMAGMLQRYVSVFSRRPFDSLAAARAFVRLTSDPEIGRPMNQALMSLFTTLAQPQYAAQLPFELRAHASLANFQARLEHYFGPNFGYDLRLSKVVYARGFEANETDPLRARVRRVGIGQNSVAWPAPQGVPTRQLQPELPPPQPAGATPETHVLREAAVYCLVSEKKPRGDPAA